MDAKNNNDSAIVQQLLEIACTHPNFMNNTDRVRQLIVHIWDSTVKFTDYKANKDIYKPYIQYEGEIIPPFCNEVLGTAHINPPMAQAKRILEKKMPKG